MKVLVSHFVISRHLLRGIAPSRLRTCCSAFLLNHCNDQSSYLQSSIASHGCVIANSVVDPRCCCILNAEWVNFRYREGTPKPELPCRLIIVVDGRLTVYIWSAGSRTSLNFSPFFTCADSDGARLQVGIVHTLHSLCEPLGPTCRAM
jgi:hypothetical protein